MAYMGIDAGDARTLGVEVGAAAKGVDEVLDRIRAGLGRADLMSQTLLHLTLTGEDLRDLGTVISDRAVAAEQTFAAAPPVDVFDPGEAPALVRTSVEVEAARAAQRPVIDFPPEPPGILERVRSWAAALVADDPFEPVARDGFTSNPVLDGEAALSRDFTIGDGLSGGVGIAVQGPNSASYQVLGGARFGATVSDGVRAPVANPTWVTMSGGTAVAFGLGAAAGLNTSYDLVTGDGVKDYYAVFNIPYIMAIGAHAVFDPDSWIPTMRLADANDVPDAGIVVGPGFLVGTDRPVADDPVLGWVLNQATGGTVGTDDAVVGLLAAFTGEPMDEVRINSQVPAGTRLTFHPDEGVLSAAAAGFAQRPGSDYDPAPTGPVLTGAELAAAAPDGTMLSFGTGPNPPPPEPDLGQAMLEASMPAGVSIDSGNGPGDDWWGNLAANTQGWGDAPVPGWTDEAWSSYVATEEAWSQASSMDSDTWPLPDGTELGSGYADLSLGGGYDSDELPSLTGYSFDSAGFTEDAWSSVDVVDFGGDW